MTITQLKSMIHISGKRGIVAYKGKETRKEFDESVSLKKVTIISNFVGNKIEEVAQILR
ncbi:hypothetical protein [Chryseobacterium bernardetii]|uniref:hypothetical protein n=1 Tax=Chryseobacterium bernardetii TaxID=1241978 RepID=UPI0016248805|nr:hypothetical protein [Chryseobacterium bernardetii]